MSAILLSEVSKVLIKNIVNVLRFIISNVKCKLGPIAYARSLGVSIGNNVHFYGMRPNMFSTEPWLITIGNNVYITNGCQFVTHDGGTLILRGEEPTLEITAPITIGDDVYIGINTTIMPGVKIGSRVIIGAGSIVTKDIPNNSVVAGIPAKKLKSVDEYLEIAKKKSLGFGHLSAKEKESAIKKHFNVSDNHGKR